MNLGIWLVPVLAGYTVRRFSHFWKRSFTSTSGYEFFFSAALTGGLLLIVARLVAWIGEVMGVSTTALWGCWKEYADFDHSGTLAVVIVLALVVVALVPAASGYRRRDTLRLELTRFYAEFPDPHKYLLVLPMTKVMSICRFDPDVYRRRTALS